MKLVRVIIEGFRGYSTRVEVPIDDLTTFIGKNDAGKSSVLEALEIFFNSGSVKIDQDDGHKAPGKSGGKVLIGCVFDDVPAKVILDTLCETTLEAEELLNADGHLEIHKAYDCNLRAPKPEVSILTVQRLMNDGKSILTLTNAELKSAATNAKLTVADRKKNPLLREALRETFEPDKVHFVLPAEGNGKSIIEEICKLLPVFALFKSDRPSRDNDDEVQDPLKVAIEQAIKTAESHLEQAYKTVEKEVCDVLDRTVAKLREMDASLAKELTPRFDPPRWKGAFSVKLDSENGIPLNKRGSGVRRLVLLNFFRAEAERRMASASAPSVIYAIEEPETSQHPNNQRLLLEAFKHLAESGSVQVLLTTHVPGLAAFVPVESIRYVCDESGARTVNSRIGDDQVAQIAQDLGVIPDCRVKVLFCVEGPNDVAFFKSSSKALSTLHGVLDLSSDHRVAFVPLGGRTLEQWVEYRYLSALGRPEFHVYDGDYAGDVAVQVSISKVNQRTDGSQAVTLQHQSAEHYLHEDAVNRHFGTGIKMDHTQKVHELVRSDMLAKNLKISLSGGRIARPHDNVVKRALNFEAAAAMTPIEWVAADPNGELLGIFQKLKALVDGC